MLPSSFGDDAASSRASIRPVGDSPRARRGGVPRTSHRISICLPRSTIEGNLKGGTNNHASAMWLQWTADGRRQKSPHSVRFLVTFSHAPPYVRSGALHSASPPPIHEEPVLSGATEILKPQLAQRTPASAEGGALPGGKCRKMSQNVPPKKDVGFSIGEWASRTMCGPCGPRVLPFVPITLLVIRLGKMGRVYLPCEPFALAGNLNN